MCWNRALLVHHTCSQCVPARRVRALRIARKHARGEILCRRLEWEQGAVSSRVASLLRSAEAKPMFYRFVRSSGPSPCTAQWRCVPREDTPPHAQRACPRRLPASARVRPHAAAARCRRPPACLASATQIHLHSPLSTRARALAAPRRPMEVCAVRPLPAATCDLLPATCYLLPAPVASPPHLCAPPPPHPHPPSSPSSTAHTHALPSAATEP